MINAFAEATPGGPTQLVRTSRPGLTLKTTLGTGPILRQFQLPGVFNGDTFSISGPQLYRQTTLLGSVAYSQFPRMAAANGQLMVVAGGGLSCYQNGTLTPILYFDDGVSPLPPFSSVTVLYNIFIYPVQNSNTFFFSKTGDGTSINALNFSSAQTNPTPIIEVTPLAEELYFHKELSTEIWDFTGSLTAPFAESQGRTYTRGAASQGSVVTQDNAIFWVGEDLVVYRSGAIPQRVSTSQVEDVLQQGAAYSSGIVAFSFNLEGHAWVVFNIPGPNQTWAYDCQTRQWCLWGTQGPEAVDPGLLLIQTAAGQSDGSIYGGSSTDGRVFQINPTVMTDAGTAMRVVVGGFAAINGGRQRCANVSLQCVRGVANGSVPDPLVQLRFSDDGGATFCGWIPARLAYVGSYRLKAVWRGLGMMLQPGRQFEFSISDAVNVTIENASINEGRP